MQTTRQLSDRVWNLRKGAWERGDHSTAVVAMEHLTPDDERCIRQQVTDAGYTGVEFDEMIRSVAAQIVRRIEALNDHQPADHAD